MRGTIAAVALVGALVPGVGMAGEFVLESFPIPGATSVNITGINDSGVAVGTYTSAAAPNGAGFVGRRGHVVTLATSGNLPVSSFVPVPTGVNDEGTVIGTIAPGAPYGFTWARGSYVASFSMSADQMNLYPPQLATGNHISFNDQTADRVSSAYSGVMGRTREIRAGDHQNVRVNSTNVHFQVAGDYYTGPQADAKLTSFVGTTAGLQTLLPPGARSSDTGWLNDAGQVAGRYYDESKALHGFIYSSGNYTVFQPAGKLGGFFVDGIDMSGRVVGAYGSGGRSHGFIYSHGVVSDIGDFPEVYLTVYISHFGRAMAMSVRRRDNTMTSYVIRCVAGPGAC